MIINSNLDHAAGFPSRRPGCRILASIDVEWTKNYKVKNGNIPFCWSVAWLQIDETRQAGFPENFAFTSAYVTDSGQTQDLIVAANTQVMGILRHADMIVGHQLSSDLAVLANVSRTRLASVEELRRRWHSRRGPGDPVVVDTRYDTGAILTGASRRLVDVCTELDMDVTQPELGHTSMTALHRRWLDQTDCTAREKITVLNLRHSLSAAYVALLSTGLGRWTTRLNVNQLLYLQLGDAFGWLSGPVFQNLL